MRVLYCGLHIFVTKSFKIPSNRFFFFLKKVSMGVKISKILCCIRSEGKSKCIKKKIIPKNWFPKKSRVPRKIWYLDITFFGTLFMKYSFNSETSIEFWIFWHPNWFLSWKNKFCSEKGFFSRFWQETQSPQCKSENKRKPFQYLGLRIPLRIQKCTKKLDFERKVQNQFNLMKIPVGKFRPRLLLLGSH